MVEPDPDRRPSRLAPLVADLERSVGRASPGSGGSPAGSTSGSPSTGSRHQDRRAKQDRKHRERGAERERRHAEREAERECRWARRHASRAGYKAARGASGIPSFIAFLMVFGLNFAEVAVLLTLRGAVPLLLWILSHVFGRRLVDAAGRVGQAGVVAASALRRARSFVQPGENDPSIGARFDPGADDARVHVTDPASAETEAEAERAAEDEARAVADDAAEVRARARRP